MRSEYKEHLDNIMDCFAGSDGGVKFVMLTRRLESIDEDAVKGDGAAQILMDKIAEFSRMVDILGRL